MTMGIWVSFLKSDRGTELPLSSPNSPDDFMGGGSSPSGNTNPLYGSYATTALTLSFLIAVSQPGPPPWEWVTKIPAPILSNKLDTAAVITVASKAPVLGVICL